MATAAAVVSTGALAQVTLPPPVAAAAPASGSVTGSRSVPLTKPAAARLGRASAPLAAPGSPQRATELTEKRTGSSKSFRRSDGSVQLELSPGPVHYKDQRGRWQDIDTSVSPGEGADAFVNAKNSFRSHFGAATDKLVRFEAGGASIGLGAVGEPRKVKPTADGSTVRFPDVFGTADVRYTVTAGGLKEDVVLDRPADIARTFTFELTTGGLTARTLPDGAIGFFKRAGDEPAFVMPAPYMYDAGDDDASRSDAVTQTVVRQGGKTLLALKPDAAWLADPKREFPVVIDPTITIVPAPDAAQDASISSASPTMTFPSGGTIPVGRASSTGTYRGLYQFDLTSLQGVDPASIRNADLNLYYSRPLTSETNAVPIEAHEVTKAWTETTATWSDLNTSFVSSLPSTWTYVDDTDYGLTSFAGTWKDSYNANAINGSMSYLPAGTTTNEYFYWNPILPGPGNYKVDARYLPASSRGSVSYVVTGDVSPATTVTVDQTTGTATGQWTQLTPSQHFTPGKTAQIRMSRASGGTSSWPVADQVRWIEYAKQTKEKDQHDAWHSFAVSTLVKKWVTTPSTNYGFMLKATDEAAGPLGGTYYHASEDIFGGGESRPKLVVTYAEPGVTLKVPTTVHADGAELAWTRYVDPTPAGTDDDLAEYQIYRGCTTLPSSDPAVPNGCAEPVGEYFPGAGAQAELVGTVDADATGSSPVITFTDSSATASTATQAASYHYWVVARTVADVEARRSGLAASNVQPVTMPREGRIQRVFTGDIADTTLSSKLPTTTLPRPDSTTAGTSADTDNRYWLQVGNSHATYGDERALLEFDTDALIKEDVKVTSAKLQLWQANAAGSGATWDLHALRRKFDEGTATWDQANATSQWAGGDFEATALANVPPTSNSPKWLTFDTDALKSKVQSWVDTPGTDFGFLLKARDEAATQQYLSLINSETPEDENFKPRLYVEHLVKNAAETFEADQVPQRFVPGTIITTPVRVTNTTDQTWPADLQLSYRWTEPESTVDITGSNERRYVPLGRALEPGESVLLDLPIRTPIESDTGAKRLAYDLYIDLWNGTQWLSQTSQLPDPPVTPDRPEVGCVNGNDGLLCVDRYVEDPTSTQLGLEKFLSYTGEETGGGSQLLTNLYSGNLVWSYDAMSNPSIGPRTFVRVAYNSQDATVGAAGYGVSVQPGTLTRLGSRLSVPSSANGSAPAQMTFVDGDGTTHKYRLREDDSTSSLAVYDRPAGVALDLTWERTAAHDKMWVFSRPDGTRFFYHQDTGLPTSVVDRNGNTTSFVHDASGRLTEVRDTAGRVTLRLGYDTDGLTWIRDLSGRALKFNYNGSHQLVKLQDGGSFDTATGTYGAGATVKEFKLGYTETSVNTNAKLNKVTDPRNASTDITYWQSTDPIPSTFALWPRRYTDRRGQATELSYADPDSSQAVDIEATVTDVNGSTPSTTRYRMDGYGRTTSIVDAEENQTKLGWDTDHNVVRLEEPNGAVSTWLYDAQTGYPLEVRDALTNKGEQAKGIVLEYSQKSGPGKPWVLDSKTSAGGRKDTFTYDDEGNLLTVRNALLSGPTYTYNDNGTLATVTDARNGVTRYGSYDENGYPLSITDPMGGLTEFTYDVRGNVIQMTDPLDRVTTSEYDAFGRPIAVTTPFEGTEKRTTATTYDLNDNVVVEKAPNGAETRYEFDAADNNTVKHLADNADDQDNTLDRRITSTYDPLGRLLEETQPKGVLTPSDPNDHVTRYTYDRLGQVLTTTTPFVDSDGQLKNPTVRYAYDAVGNKITEIDPKKNASGGTDITTRWAYDVNHQTIAITDAAGFTSRNQYDRDGLLVAEIDALGNKKTTVYDDAAQPVEVHTPHTPYGTTKAEDRVAHTVYDPSGNPTHTATCLMPASRPAGTFLCPEQEYAETVYDLNNRPTRTKSPYKAGDKYYAKSSVTVKEYDDAGQVTRQAEPVWGDPTDLSTLKWTDFTYFDSGEVKTSTDPWKITTVYDYNEIGKQTDRTLKADGDDATRTKKWSFFPDGSLKTHSDTAAQQPVDIVDNVDTWQVEQVGTWTAVSGGTNTQGTSYRYHAAAAAGSAGASDTFTWDVTPDVGGNFELFVSCPVRTDSTTAATYTVNHQGGATNKTINQKACTSATPWVSLGSYVFTSGITKAVVLKPSTSGVVVADALKVVALDPPTTNSFTHTYDANGAETEVRDTGSNPTTDLFRSTYDGLGRATKVEELKSDTTLRQTEYSYDLNSNPATISAQQFAVNGLTAASRYTGFTFDLRNLPDTVKAGDTAATATDTWQFVYDARGMRSKLTKPNGNVQTSTYHEDGKLRTLVERLSTANGGTSVASHNLKYWPTGDLKEDNAKVDQGNSTNSVDQIATYEYSPAQKVTKVTKTGVSAEKGDNEVYLYDAAGNTLGQQMIGSATTTTCSDYDRNRLTKTRTFTSAVDCLNVGSASPVVTRHHRYDVLGRSTTIDETGKVVERYSYDGFDRMVRHQKWKVDGTHEVTKSMSYDVFDRTATRTQRIGSGSASTARFMYLGLEDQIAVEEQTNTAGTYELSKAYNYLPGGEKLALVDTPVNGSTTKKFFYGTNVRGDVEFLTGTNGAVTSSYRYTAYGNTDEKGTTGDDKVTGDQAADAEVVNPYRFGGKRYEAATGTYDMGFRDYNPGLNKFLTRDMYDGALDDMALGSDPWNTNRYAFAGGNPISRVELDGHWGISLSGMADAVSGAVGEIADAASVINDAVADGATAVGEFVVEHKATIAGVATGIAAYAGCTAATVGGGAVACAAVAGAAGSAVQNALDEKGDHSVAGFAKSMAGGAALGVVTLGAGKALAPVLSKVTAPLKTAAGNAAGKMASSMRNSVSKIANKGCSSFAGATVVLMADGTSKPIDQIRVGDLVLATDPETGQQVAREVTAVWVHDDTLIDLLVDGQRITTTEDHPFWNVTDGEWQRADELTPGDQVLTAEGRLVTVEGLDFTSTYEALAYNLTVAGTHTYHVGTAEILVHNTAACKKVYVTYTKYNPKTGKTYSGRTSGKVGERPDDIVARRDARHHVKADYEPARLDQSSTNKAAIRGREQQLIDHYGGAARSGGTSGNEINGISFLNPLRSTYLGWATRLFGGF